jgi:Mn2+/Fe2+ NRAMP family transporter
MEKRIEELKDLEKLKLIKREKWKEGVVGIVIGILGTVVGGLILYWIT